MNCPTCGTPVAPGAKFCGTCGNPLSTPATPAPSDKPAGARSALPKMPSSARPDTSPNMSPLPSAHPLPPIGAHAAEPTPKRGVPKPLLIGGAALLAIAVGGGAALMLGGGSSSAQAMTVDTNYTGHLNGAPKTSAPSRIWSISNTQVAQGAGLQAPSPDASATVKLLNAGSNKIDLANVTYDNQTFATVGIDETSGKPVFKVAKNLTNCVDDGAKSGWYCLDGSTISHLDSKGGEQSVTGVKSNVQLVSDPAGKPWAWLGGNDGANSEVILTKLDGGKAAWTFDENLTNTPTNSFSTSGLSSSPFFTSGNSIYLPGYVDPSTGTSAVLNEKTGKLKKGPKTVVVGNLNGVPVRQSDKNDGWVAGSKKLPADVSALVNPSITDSADTPAFILGSGNVEQAKLGDSTPTWRTPGSQVDAYCGTNTLISDGTNASIVNSSGTPTSFTPESGAAPVACWQGKQLVYVTNDSLFGYDAAKGTKVWQSKVADSATNESISKDSVFKSMSTDGFITANGQSVSYWG